MVVRSWKYRTLSGTGKRLSIPQLVTERLYEGIEEYLPHVAAETVLRRALVYLKYAAVPDPRSRYLPFHERAAAQIRQAPSLARRNEARVYDLAENFKNALEKDLEENGIRSTVRIIPHGKGQNCVQITPFALPDPVEQAFAEEREHIFLLDTPTRNLQTGSKDRPGDRKDRREKRQRKAETTGKRLGVPSRLRELQRNLHALPPKRFTSKCKAAREEIAGLIKKRAREREGACRTPYMSQLRAIADVPVPLYKFTKSTLRLTPAGSSLAALPKKMRRAVLEDYLEVDMSSAQLALAASLWGDLEDLREFLRACIETNGKSWWAELIGWLRRKLPTPKYKPERDFAAVKGVLKGFTYGLFYGMEIHSLRRLGNPHDPSTDAKRYYRSIRTMNRLFLPGMKHPRPWEQVMKIGNVLFKHPLVRSLLSRRREMLSKIEAQGGIVDCFGRHVSTTGERGPKSVLAEYMQNAELRVMLPVGEAILDDSNLKFGLWQHDGVTMAPRRKEAWAYRKAVRKAREALQQGREALEQAMNVPSIETELTVDYGAEYLQQ
jgi:hypothetical protein